MAPFYVRVSASKWLSFACVFPVRSKSRVGHGRLCGVTTAGFPCPLTKPDMHLSLCIRLSRSHRVVGFTHPAAPVASDGNTSHQKLLVRSLAPYLLATIRYGLTPACDLMRVGLGEFLAHPAPQTIPYIPIQLGEDFFGVGAIAIEIPPPTEDGVKFLKLSGQRPVCAVS